jgi:hypothetical protein
MGLFDYVRSSYSLGEEFTDIELHTKDIEKGIGGTMSRYWIDPAGQLWMVDYRDAFDFDEDPNWKNDGKVISAIFKYKFLPNGKHGKLVPQNITDYVCVYPAQWDKEWKDWPTCRVHFVNGVIQDYKNILISNSND